MSIINEALKKARREQDPKAADGAEEIIQPRVRVSRAPVTQIVSGLVVLCVFLGLLGLGAYYAWNHFAEEQAPQVVETPAQTEPAPEEPVVVQTTVTLPTPGPVPEATPEPPPPTETVVSMEKVDALLDSLQITSVLVGGGLERAVINGRVRSVGDTLETDPPLKLIAVERNLLRFALPDGREVQKRN